MVIGKRSFRPSHATIVAYLALFVALGGTAYAATSLPANSVGTKQLRNGAVTTPKLRDQAVTGRKVANNSLTGTQINASTLGTVPNAAHAVNADRLAGSPASTFLAHCPSGMKRVPNGNLCFDSTARPNATWIDALNTCALAGLHLPTPGELAQAFNDLDAFQLDQWTSTAFGISLSYGVEVLRQSTTRQITPDDILPTETVTYRCVTDASN